jgi:hypothetical protein
VQLARAAKKSRSFPRLIRLYRSIQLVRSMNMKAPPQLVLNTSTLPHRCRRERPPHHKIQPNVRFGPESNGIAAR